METSAVIIWIIFAFILMVGSLLAPSSEHFGWWGPGWRHAYGWWGYPRWGRPYYLRRARGCPYRDCPYRDYMMQ